MSVKICNNTIYNFNSLNMVILLNFEATNIICMTEMYSLVYSTNKTHYMHIA